MGRPGHVRQRPGADCPVRLRTARRGRMKPDSRNRWIRRRHNMPYEERKAEDRANRADFEELEDGAVIRVTLPPLHLLHEAGGGEPGVPLILHYTEGEKPDRMHRYAHGGVESGCVPKSRNESLRGAVRSRYRRACKQEAPRQWGWFRQNRGRETASMTGRRPEVQPARSQGHGIPTGCPAPNGTNERRLSRTCAPVGLLP